MPLQTDLIVNGTFDAGSAGWSGTDLETTFPENAYLGNGSGNRVAEIDGVSNQITVMQQTVTVEAPQSTVLTFRSALRTASQGNAGREGFRVDILDQNGTVIATRTVFPPNATWQTYSVAVTFPAAGNYRVRFTELGPNDSLGAIVDDVSMVVCFASGTQIKTAAGPRLVEDLRPGDLIWTADSGYQPLLWVGRRQVSVDEQRQHPQLCAVEIAPGALGNGLPRRLLRLSPQHRVLVRNWKAQLFYGEEEVLVPAIALVNGQSVRRAPPQEGLCYVHILLDRHHLVKSEGVLTESFFPSAQALRAIPAAARDELCLLFPDLLTVADPPFRTARTALRRHEGRVLCVPSGRR
ncbi:MAG: Hint domain-containing protein [Cypionkella sp.]|jgi:hypothetical protein|nr:Hint domain-containing protein [Cypionkella sp.]